MSGVARVLPEILRFVMAFMLMAKIAKALGAISSMPRAMSPKRVPGVSHNSVGIFLSGVEITAEFL
jgi:hypothetical protein